MSDGKCKECGYPIEACNEIAILKRDRKQLMRRLEDILEFSSQHNTILWGDMPEKSTATMHKFYGDCAVAIARAHDLLDRLQEDDDLARGERNDGEI